MTSRSLHDLYAAISYLNAFGKETDDPLFKRKFFTPEGVYHYSKHDSNDALRIEERPQRFDTVRNTTVEGKAAVPFTSSMPNSSLCEACKFLVTSWPTERQMGRSTSTEATQNGEASSAEQKLTFQEMCNSARLGCHLCDLRLRTLKQYDVKKLQQIRACTYSFWARRPDGNVIERGATQPSQGISLDYSLTDPEESRLETSLLLCEAEVLIDDKRDTHVFSRPCNDTTLPWDLIRSWLHDCENVHIFCKAKETRGTFLPTRLIKLPRISEPQDTMSVVYTANLPRNTRYATLSHCWGQSPFHLFIKTAPEDYFQAIPLHQIPQLFRDAIKIVQNLGLWYIWIDCFCIKQGCLEDWKSESAKMNQVYQFSFINLAASKPVCSEESIFYARDPLDIDPCIIQTDWLRDGSGIARRWVAYEPRLLYDRNIAETSLSERAWVVQELVLAPRVLHTGTSQMFWECDSLRACEMFPTGIPNLSLAKLSTSLVSLQYDFERGLRYESYKYRLWAKIVNAYSARKLTKVVEDKLIALSGVAKAIGASPEEYLAGLWKEDLAYHLLWKPIGPGKRAPLSETSYQAPSWSWASYNGPINYRVREGLNLERALLVRIVDAQTEKTSDDLTGRVKGGYLHIEAPLAVATFQHRILPSDTESNLPLLNGCHGRFTLDDIEALGSERAEVDSRLYLMPVEFKVDAQRNILIVGLILHASSKQRDNTFQRGGYFTVTNHLDKSKMITFFETFRNSENRLQLPVVELADEIRTDAMRAAELLTYSFKII